MNVLQRKVLKVNAHCEPEAIITAVRAVLLVYRGRAEVLKWDDTEIHTSTRTHKVPSIIRVLEYHNLRKKREGSSKQRGRIFIRDKFRCQYCSKRFQVGQLTLDHIIPKGQGGLDTTDNLATSCKPCNQRKGNRTPDESRMPLLATPSALKYGLDRALMLHYAETRPEWHEYLYLDKAQVA